MRVLKSAISIQCSHIHFSSNQTSATSEKSEIIRTVKLIRAGGGGDKQERVDRNSRLESSHDDLHTKVLKVLVYMCKLFQHRDMKGNEHKQCLSDKLIGNLSSIK